MEQLDIQPHNNNKNIFVIVFLILFVAILSSVSTYSFLISRQNSSNYNPNKVSNNSSPIATIVPTYTVSPVITTKDNELKLIQADNMGGFVFEYPYGWHVASFWPNKSEDGINIIIDPKPITNAPRGGPLGEITINYKNGLNNPDEVFRKEIEDFKKTIEKDLIEEQLQSEVGTIHHYKGKANIYMELKPIEGYFFEIQPLTLSDLINKQVISAKIYDNSKRSELLRKIVLSFRKK